MKRTITVSLVLLAVVLFCSVVLQPVHSSVSGTIFIKPDGSVTPSTAPIHRQGQTYTLTGNIKTQIVLETGNIVLDGAGFKLEGGGGGVAVNMTCSNVTIENFQMTNWQAGVLGVFNNNTVENCLITGCQSALKIYAQYYVILANTIEKNSEGIRIGQGGLNYIAGNNITGNDIGLYLFDSGNVIVQNSISGCSQSAVILDEAGWSQTVYQNNFVSNKRNLDDYTYNDYPQRPVQSTVPAWDNGSSGNYWSDYTGTDINGDGIGDTPHDIITYNLNNAMAPYNFVDRYPLMTPFNIKGAIPPVPPQLNAPQVHQSISTANDEAEAVSFLRNVLQLDLNKYKVALTSESVQVPNSGYASDYLNYQLSHNGNNAIANLQFANNTLTSCNLNGALFGQLLFTCQYSNGYDTSKRIMQNYQTWKNDRDVEQMVNLLNTAGSGKNTTELSGNIDLKIVNASSYSTFDWKYSYNGADYSGVSISFEGHVSNLMFSDNRAVYNIGNTTIGVSKQQAIQIAQDYVDSIYRYSVDFGNGTSVIVKSLNVNDTAISANLATSPRDSTTLYPYWVVQVALDQTYPGNTIGVTVQVWADTGTVFQAQREVGPININPFSILPSFTLLSEALVIPLIIVVAVIVVIVLWLNSSNKKGTENNARASSLNPFGKEVRNKMSVDSGKRLGLTGSLIELIAPVLMITALVLFLFYLFAAAISAMPSFVAIEIFFIFIGIVWFIGYVLFIIAMHHLSQYYNEPAIFRNTLFGFIVNLIAAVSVITIEIILIFTSIARISTPSVSNFFMQFLIGYLTLLAVAFVLAIVSGIFYMRGFNKLAEESGVDNFRTAGLLYLIGAATAIIGIGVLIQWIAWIFAAMGYRSLKPREPLTSPLTYTAPQPTASGIMEKKYCPYCGSENKASAIYCSTCGKQIKQ